MQPTPEHNEKIRKLTFSAVFPHYLTKIKRKGRNEDELYAVIEWLTGFDKIRIHKLIEENVSFESFFEKAKIHPDSTKIKGTICGYKVHEIENNLTKQVRYLDLLVDELARGKKLSIIFRMYIYSN